MIYYCFLFVVTQVLYTGTPITLTAVGFPNKEFGISKAIDNVLAPSKVSVPGTLKPELSEGDGAITSLNRLNRKRRDLALVLQIMKLHYL